MAAKVPREKIGDCRELYLRYGGAEHDRIASEMRGLGWRDFTKRNLYARTRGGRVTPGWPERFGWDEEMQKPARKQGRYTQRCITKRPGSRRRPGPAYGKRRNSNSSSFPQVSVSAVKPPRTFASHREPHAISQHIGRGHNRQKARRDIKDASAGNAGALACNAGSSGVRNADIHAASGRSRVRAGEGACAPGTDPFHAWLKTLPGIWNWDLKHQIYLYERLKRVTDGTCKRLMIFMPPRHGKSELVTVRYSAWRLRQDPKLRIILGSYSQHLADNFSRKIRRVLADDAAAAELRNADCGMRIQSDETDSYTKPPDIQSPPDTRNCSITPNPHSAFRDPQLPQSPFPFANRPINRVSEWETSEGGGLKAVGVGGGVTGFGADLIVIDDPVKSRAEAESKVYRERLWNWFNDDLYTRLEPGGAIILIQTRWHEDDLAGRLLDQMQNGGQQWEVVSLPALAETAELRNAECGLRIQIDEADSYSNTLSNLRCSIPTNPRSAIRDPQSADPLGRLPGAALWPERFDIAELGHLRQTMSEYSFAALYQQRPAPAEGGVFKRRWFGNIVAHAPAGLKWKRGYDLAVSTRTSADYTASFRVAFDAVGNLYIDGGFRRRIDFPEQRRYMLERFRLERDTEHGIELALHGRAAMQDLRRNANALGRHFRGIAVKGDKHTRALSWISLAEEGRIRLVRGPWNKPFVEEACTFPHGKHDDQIDAVSLAVAMHEQRPGKLYVFD